jgi:hypothetical protein
MMANFTPKHFNAFNGFDICRAEIIVTFYTAKLSSVPAFTSAFMAITTMS